SAQEILADLKEKLAAAGINRKELAPAIEANRSALDAENSQFLRDATAFPLDIGLDAAEQKLDSLRADAPERARAGAARLALEHFAAHPDASAFPRESLAEIKNGLLLLDLDPGEIDRAADTAEQALAQARALDALTEKIPLLLRAAVRDDLSLPDGFPDSDAFAAALESANDLLLSLAETAGAEPWGGILADFIEQKTAAFADEVEKMKTSLGGVALELVKEARELADSEAPGLAAIADLEKRLADQEAALDGKRGLGSVFRQELAVQLAEAGDGLALKRIALQLRELSSDKILDYTLAELRANIEARPDAPIRNTLLKMIDEFSSKQLGQLDEGRENLAAAKINHQTNPAAARSGFASLAARAGRILSPADQDAFAARLAASRGSYAERLAGHLANHRYSAKSRHGWINDVGDKKSLRRLLAAGFGDPVLLAGLGENAALRESLLASLAIGDAAGVFAALDDLAAGSPSFSRLTLEIKMELGRDFGLEAKSTALAHEGVQLRQQLYAAIRDNGGGPLLEDIGANDWRGLDADKIRKLLEHSPNLDASPFNILLAKTLWNAFLLADASRDGGAADLESFRQTLPAALRQASPAALRDMFELGALSTRRLEEAADWAGTGGGVIADGQIQDLMDAFAARDAKVLCRRALTAMLRNFLDSHSVAYDPGDNSSGAYAKALAGWLDKNLGEGNVAQRGADAVRRRLGLASEAAGGDFKAQVSAALDDLAGMDPLFKELERELAGLQRGMEALEEEIGRVLPEATHFAGLKPGDALPPENSEARVKALADPWNFLVHQNALTLEGDEVGIDHSKVAGEPLAMLILSYQDVLEGRVDGIGDAAERQLSALRELQLPLGLSLKYMTCSHDAAKVKKNGSLDIPDSCVMDIHAGGVAHIRTKVNVEDAAFLGALYNLRRVDLSAPGGPKEFERLKDEILGMMAKYGLPDKAEKILALKGGNRQASLAAENSTFAANLKSAVSDVALYGDSPVEAAAAKSGVSHADAMLEGLRKVKLEAPATGSPADSLRRHFLSGERLLRRGSAANLETAAGFALSDQRRSLDRHRLLLAEAMRNFSTNNILKLRDIVRMAALQAFSEMPGFSEFSQAEAELAEHGVDSEFFQRIRENLKRNFSLDDKLAGYLAETHILAPIRAARLGDQRPVLSAIAEEASPSLSRRLADFRLNFRLAPEIRELARAEANRERFAVLLEQLSPGVVMSFDKKNAVKLEVQADLGPAQVGLAAEAARTKGVGVGQNSEGEYQVVVNSGAEGGLGVGAAFLAGSVRASAGLAVSGGDEMTFTFKDKDSCARFLGKMADASCAAADVAELCSNLEYKSSLAIGAHLGVEIALGELQIMDNSLGLAVFGAEFSASGRAETSTSEDIEGQSVAVERRLGGSLGLKLTLGLEAAEEKSAEETREENLDATLEGARGARLAAAEMPLADGGGKFLGAGASLTAEVSREDAAVSLDISLAASRLNRVSRSTVPGAKGELLAAVLGTEVRFSGRYAAAAFRKYAEETLRLAPENIKQMLADIAELTAGMDEPSFTLGVENSLTGESLAECRRLEKQVPPDRDGVKRLLAAPGNYRLGKAVLSAGTFSREKSQEFGLTRGPARLGVSRSASGNEITSREYAFD
ncbi:MAG: hypothetical protein LBU23_08770, partial [Planctomycetota bacterium]|nr:hypothetical protein [Planctomycetota bacterium]